MARPLGYATLGGVILTCGTGSATRSTRLIRPRGRLLRARCSGRARGRWVVGQFTIRDVTRCAAILADARLSARDDRCALGDMGGPTRTTTPGREVLQAETLAGSQRRGRVRDPRSKSGAAASRAVPAVGSLAFSAARASGPSPPTPAIVASRLRASDEHRATCARGAFASISRRAAGKEPHPLDSDAILSAPVVARPPSRGRAIQFLQTGLRGPLAATEVLRRAAAGLESTSTRREKQAGVIPSKSGPDGAWVWKIATPRWRS